MNAKWQLYYLQGVRKRLEMRLRPRLPRQHRQAAQELHRRLAEGEVRQSRQNEGNSLERRESR